MTKKRTEADTIIIIRRFGSLLYRLDILGLDYAYRFTIRNCDKFSQKYQFKGASNE